MPEFQYIAKNKLGKEIKGVLVAKDAADLREKLLGKEYMVIDCYQVEKTVEDDLGFFAKLKKVSNKDLAIFTWQLYTMTNAGVPLTKALVTVSKQTKSQKLQKVILNVVDHINSGSSLSEALQKYPQVFTTFFVHMVEVGEVGGVLDHILMKIAEYYETQVERKTKIVSALSYPIVLLAGCTGVILFLILFLIPRLFRLFENISADIPTTTLLLIKLSEFLKHNGYLVLIMLIGLILGIKFYTRTSEGRLLIDRFKLRIPIIGNLLNKILLSRFSHTLSIMLNGGVPILGSLKVVRELMGNKVMSNMIDDVIEGVSEGDQLNEQLHRHALVPDMVVNMIGIGEETGTLGTMLSKISDYYEKEVNSAIKNLTKVMEPMLLVVMACVVGFIAISVLDPVTDLITKLK